MKKFVICAATLGLFAFVPLSAQSNDHRGDHRDASAPERGRDAHPAGAAQQDRKAPAAAPQNNQGGAMRSGTLPGMTKPAGHAAIPQSQPVQRGNVPASGGIRQPVHSNAERAPNNAPRPGNAMQVRPQQGDRAGHSGRATVANRPDLNTFRRNIQAPRQFHHGSYQAPQGYNYRHWSYGETLPRGYYARNYWISDFLMFGLFAPPSDLIWVRVGNDALLIDRDSGDIVQVRYGVFY